ncbi:putative efflux protein, MATE family [Cohaesibacter sp. ES.047]|uniref:MATE family efflux transporter n=1 Tax=Cohaesibacter sp. ES.047 TaxID=1798205 RepID=UPI000BB7FF4A|nr:MATE family efflux transporter [Cohaesibacter sp. ES.047]SNY94386.1 putative efflux protein, MATE family [Cohaesibacter sp. ES.047]
MSSDSSSNTIFVRNKFTEAPLGSLFAKTALPVIFVMSMNGLLTVVDAMFLGVYVGTNALAAVTLMFPLYMLVIALTTLVSNGMSSLLARHLGANRINDAQALFAGAHGLALFISLLFIAAFLTLGVEVTLILAGNSAELADLGYIYLRIVALSTPLYFILSLHTDALRNEGYAGLMAGMSLLVSLANIAFDYLLIVQLDMGVAGSAYGTVLAQALALAIIIGFRIRGKTHLKPAVVWRNSLFAEWRAMLALGAPQSLNFLGMALVSTAIITSLQLMAVPNYAETVTAYGIITRITTFVFLPMMGLALSFQTIIGNNYGAELWHRSDKGLRIGLALAFIYCLVVEFVLITFTAPIGHLFTADEKVVAEVARIIPMAMAMYFISGPILITSSYFQAIGDAARAAILGLSKAYLFLLPMIFTLPLLLGERGIWLASPIAEVLLFATALLVLTKTAKSANRKWGLFVHTEEPRS